MHCQQGGGEFVHDLGTWELLEGVPIGSGSFWKVSCRVGLMGRSNRPLDGQMSGRRFNRPGKSEKNFALCGILMLHCSIGSGGGCFGSRWACICVGGALCVVRALDWWFVLLAWAWFCLEYIEPLPLPKWFETVFFKWFCSLSFFAFRSLVDFFIRFFSFSFLSGYYMCVLSMHSSRRTLRNMCGSRTGGWSLPGVISDWQHCVDWLLAKYCRCRFRFD
jgi:hypothetical protein